MRSKSPWQTWGINKKNSMVADIAVWTYSTKVRGETKMIVPPKVGQKLSGGTSKWAVAFLVLSPYAI